MPNSCHHFGALEQRIKDLTAKFLSDQIIAESSDPTGFVADFDRLAAFRLLVHAEIEDFLESKAREGLAALTSALNRPGLKICNVSSIFTLASVLRDVLQISWPYNETNFINEARRLVSVGEAFVANNNGIKGNSYFQLSVMSGKMPDEVDQSLGSSLTSYGKCRGDVAHKSVTRVRTLQAPSAEFNEANNIVLALAAYFDVMAPNRVA